MARTTSTSTTKLMPLQPDAMTPAHRAAVSYLARYSGTTHALYIRHLDESGLMASSVNTAMHAGRGFFRFAHIDGRTVADPAVYA